MFFFFLRGGGGGGAPGPPGAKIDTFVNLYVKEIQLNVTYVEGVVVEGVPQVLQEVL